MAEQDVIAPITPQNAPESEIEAIIRAAANKYGISEGYFVSIARCETTTLNPNAVNYGYSENGKDFPSGLFQHLTNYWPARAIKYGYAGANVFDPVANANVTAAMFAEGLEHLWACK